MPSGNLNLEEEPATKEELTEELETQRYQERVFALAESYTAIDPATAAKDLEIMTGALDLVCDILLIMSAKDSAAIISNMSAVSSAKVTKKMSAKLLPEERLNYCAESCPGTMSRSLRRPNKQNIMFMARRRASGL